MSHRPIIKKLFESILSETPDRALSGDASDSEDKLKQVGLNPKKIAGMRWTDVDAVTFIVDVRNHATMWLGNDENERAFQHSDFSEYFTGAQRDSKYPKKGVIGADWKNYRAVVAGIGSLSNPMNKNLILGRLWLDSRFVSFWSSKENVLREWKTVMDFLVNMKVDPRKSVYEFVDLPEIELFDEVTRNDAPVGAINEDPDAIVSDVGKWSFQDTDAYTVIWHPTRNLFFRTRSSNDDDDDDTSGYHNGLLTTLWRIGKVFRDGGITTPEEYNEYADVMEYDVQWDAPGGIISVGHGRNARAIDAEGSTSAIVNYCENLVDVSDDSDGDDRFYTRDFRMMYAKLGIMCRWWEDTQVLSFWLNKRDLGRLIKKGALTGLFEHLGIAPDHARLNTVEKNSGLFSTEDAVAAAGGKPSMSREKELELMRKQHLDDKAKRELGQNAVNVDKYGGILPAEYHAKSRTSDGVIKLGSLIPEQKSHSST